MRGSYDSLIDGAQQAAESAMNADLTQPQLAIGYWLLAIGVSCVGRKIILG